MSENDLKLHDKIVETRRDQPIVLRLGAVNKVFFSNFH